MRGARLVLGLALVVAGLVWSALFPKKASLAPDMVASVAVGLGLVGSGGLVLAAERLRRTTLVLSLLLLWSALGNAFLLAWSTQAREVLLRKTSEAHAPGERER